MEGRGRCGERRNSGGRGLSSKDGTTTCRYDHHVLWPVVVQPSIEHLRLAGSAGMAFIPWEFVYS